MAWSKPAHLIDPDNTRRASIARDLYARHIDVEVYHEAIERLSRHEIEALEALIDGCSNKAIARRLSISVAAAEGYRASMMAKLNVRTAADAVRIGIYAGVSGATHSPREALVLTTMAAMH